MATAPAPQEGGFSLGQGVSLAGSVIQGFGQLFSGIFGAQQSRRQAEYVQQRAKADLADAARQFRATQGAAVTAVGKSGLQIDGSALDVLVGNAGAYGRDVGAIKANAKNERRALKAQARSQMATGAFGALSSWLPAGNALFNPGTGSAPAPAEPPYQRARIKTYGARPSRLPGGGDV